MFLVWPPGALPPRQCAEATAGQCPSISALDAKQPEDVELVITHRCAEQRFLRCPSCCRRSSSSIRMAERWRCWLCAKVDWAIRHELRHPLLRARWLRQQLGASLALASPGRVLWPVRPGGATMSLRSRSSPVRRGRFDGCGRYVEELSAMSTALLPLSDEELSNKKWALRGRPSRRCQRARDRQAAWYPVARRTTQSCSAPQSSNLKIAGLRRPSRSSASARCSGGLKLGFTRHRTRS